MAVAHRVVVMVCWQCDGVGSNGSGDSNGGGGGDGGGNGGTSVGDSSVGDSGKSDDGSGDGDDVVMASAAWRRLQRMSHVARRRRWLAPVCGGLACGDIGDVLVVLDMRGCECCVTVCDPV